MAANLAEEQVFRRGNGSEVQTLDPHKAEGVPASNILRDLYEGLTIEEATNPLTILAVGATTHPALEAATHALGWQQSAGTQSASLWHAFHPTGRQARVGWLFVLCNTPPIVGRTSLRLVPMRSWSA